MNCCDFFFFFFFLKEVEINDQGKLNHIIEVIYFRFINLLHLYLNHGSE